MSNVRLSVLGVSSEHGAVKTTLVGDCSNLQQVEALFDSRREWPPSREGQRHLPSFGRRIYIVESVFRRYSPSGSTKDEFKLETLLRDNLGVPDDFFRSHARERTNFDSNEVVRCPHLPTALSLDKRFSLEHFELWTYLGSDENIQGRCSVTNKTLCPGDGGYTLMCKTTKRQIQIHKWKTRGGWLLVAPRKCSYWSKMTRHGWDVLILCDPAPSTVQVGGSVRDLDIRPFHGGPHGFIPEEYVSCESQPSQNPVEAAFRSHHDDAYNIRYSAFLSSTILSETTFCLENFGTDSSNSLEQITGDMTQISSAIASEASSQHPSPAPTIRISPRREEYTPQIVTEHAPHSSFYDDLLYYFGNHVHLLDGLEDPMSMAVFPKKLVASHYSQLLGFVSHQTSTMRSPGWAIKQAAEIEFNATNAADTNRSKYRCAEYIEALDATMDQLGIPIFGAWLSQLPEHQFSPYHRDSTRTPTNLHDVRGNHGKHPPDEWCSSIPDFHFLHRELCLRRADLDSMTASFAALGATHGGRGWSLDTRWNRLLGLIAMLFIPPACIASIFGMSDSFAPGQSRFWLYWAVAVPMTLAVFVFVFGVLGWNRLRARRIGGVGAGGRKGMRALAKSIFRSLV